MSSEAAAPKQNIFRRTVNTGVDLLYRYADTRPTTKAGVALIFLGIVSGGLALASGDPLAAGLCCNTLGGSGAVSLGVSAVQNYSQRKS